MKRVVAVFLVLGVVFLLFSCGLGGGGGSSRSLPAGLQSAVRAEVSSLGHSLADIKNYSKVGGESATGEQVWRVNVTAKISNGEEISMPVIVSTRH